MPTIILIVFLAVFALIALVMVAVSGSKASRQKQATLDFVLKKTGVLKDDGIVDVRKNDRLSTIPWVHELLVRIQAAVELRRVLDQADVKWTPVRLMLTSATMAVVTGFLVYRRTEVLNVSAVLGVLGGLVPFVYVWNKRARRL